VNLPPTWGDHARQVIGVFAVAFTVAALVTACLFVLPDVLRDEPVDQRTVGSLLVEVASAVASWTLYLTPGDPPSDEPPSD